MEDALEDVELFYSIAKNIDASDEIEVNGIVDNLLLPLRKWSVSSYLPAS
jgi:hypothetical protein